MNDFADYAPGLQSSGPDVSIETRSAEPNDADALATIMAVRGGGVEEHVDRARQLIERLNVLLIAEKVGAPVGWCGIQKSSIHPDRRPEWLIAGLTVIPEVRRQGVATRLLGEVLRATPKAVRTEPVFSVINARNLASIDLHVGLGFVEVGRSETFAGIDFTGGEGILLRHS